MSFVLDASVPLSWCFDEAQAERTKGVLTALESEKAIVPAIWAVEVSHALAAGERRKRIDAARIERFLSQVRELAIEVDVDGTMEAFSRVLPLARRHQLSAYDACYLELALRFGRPLATLDSVLGKAARGLGIALLMS